MRFECEFINPATAERRKLTVALDPDEIAALKECEAAGANSELMAQAYALRHAYRERPHGFVHVQHGVRPVPVH